MKALFYVALAMTAIAGDSFFTRLALSTTDIAPSTFSILRIFSACLIVVFIIPVTAKASSPSRPLTLVLSALFILYIFAFSYAYTELPISLGGLVLFSVTQVCSIFFSVNYLGKRLNPIQWFAFLVASIGGLSLLTPPITLGNSTTPMYAMALAGLAWSGFTIITHQKEFSIFSLRKVFTYTAVLISPLVINLIVMGANSNLDGYVYAVLCGTLTTGLGYSLRLLIADSITSVPAAGTAQISVPLMTILLGVAFLSEPLSIAVTSASILIIFSISIFFLSEYLKNFVSEK